jgi:hypothetical protein
MEISMDATLADYFEDFELTNVKPPVPQPKNKIPAGQPRSKKTDIPLWLSNNAPRNVEELKAVRYALYHRCSRAEFKVSQKQDVNNFLVSGRLTSVHIVSNKARRFLLWKLRTLAKERGWVGRRCIEFFAIG